MSARKIKVLFLTYPRIGLNLGGLEIQIQKTAEALQALGLEVIFYDPWRNQLPEVDICHVFSIEGTLIYHIERAVSMGKPVVLSPVFNSFAGKTWQTVLKAKLGRYIPGVYTDLKRAWLMLHAAACILPLNADEGRLLRLAFDLPAHKLRCVPNGIDLNFHSPDPHLFTQQFGVQNFVLQVASVEKRKNQLNLIKAMADLPYPLVLIGKASASNQAYWEECQAAAGKNVLFVGQLEHSDPLLASAFAAAKLFVLPSYSEVMPLTLYEAALAGCQLAISRNVPLDPSIQAYTPLFDPDNPQAIAAVIDNAMRTATHPAILQAVQQLPSWRDVGITLQQLYAELLGMSDER